MTDSRDSPGARRLDWDAAHARLQRAQEAIDKVMRPPPEQVARVLQERAAKLATPLAAPAATTRLEVVAFGLGAERYAVQASYVGGAIALPRVTPVPGIPACYRGIFIQRGTVYSLVDIRYLRAAAAAAAATPQHALLLEDGTHFLALAADEIEGYTALDAAAVAPAPAGPSGEAGFLQGLAPGSLLLLDAPRLLHDLRLQVNHQPTGRTHTPTEEKST